MVIEPQDDNGNDHSSEPVGGITQNFYRGCDESKCVSRGRSDLFNESFTCYGDEDGMFFPRMCSHGYLPEVVVDEPVYLANTSDGYAVPVMYFTCCPPIHRASNYNALGGFNGFRQCSDPITITENTTEEKKSLDAQICQEEPVRTNARRLNTGKRSRGHGWSIDVEKKSSAHYVCCENDSNDMGNNLIIVNLNPTSDNPLNATQCLPYHNDHFDGTRIQNRVGSLVVVWCDFQDGDFVVPRHLSGIGNDLATTGRYQCCRSGEGLPPFIQDEAFAVTIYPALALFCMAALASIIVVIGLLLPLMLQLKHGTFQKSRDTTSRSSMRRSSYMGGATIREKSYSTYNLYLVFLAVPDLTIYIYWIAMAVSMIRQDFYPSYYSFLVFPSKVSSAAQDSIEIFVLGGYVVANLWINAIIAYQVLLLFQNSERGRRMNQPSLRRLNMQASGAYCLAAFNAGISYYFMDTADKAKDNNDMEKRKIILSISLTWTTLVTLLPIFYVIYVGVLVWRKGYIPKLRGITIGDRAKRELAMYFFRIIAVFVVAWIPGTVLFYYYGVSGSSWTLVAITCTGPIQGLLNTCMVLTKTDVRRYIWDLVSLSYLFGSAKDKYKRKHDRGTIIRNSDSGKGRTSSSMFFRDSSQKSTSRLFGSFQDSSQKSISKSFQDSSKRSSGVENTDDALDEGEEQIDFTQDEAVDIIHPTNDDIAEKSVDEESDETAEGIGLSV